MALFEIKSVDRVFYETKLMDFLPDKLIDIHTHVWLEKFRRSRNPYPVRSVTWPGRVASENPIELLFPGKEVTPVIFGKVSMEFDFHENNKYISECAGKHGFPALAVTAPGMSSSEFEETIERGGFFGCKVYLNFAEPYIPSSEIRIFDFLPHHQLEVLNRRGWAVMLHIARPGRLKDPVNLAQMLEIERRYPNIKLIIAHIGRAYVNEDVGNAFEVLAETKNMVFDFSANTNQWVFEQTIKAVGPKRILFGSDMPILRMRSKRITKDGIYVNLVPKGLYGDVSGDKNMGEVEGEEAEKLTFFMYEEIDAMRRAALNTGLGKGDIEDMFYNNAKRIIDSVK